jgi:hypothetical protein
MGANDMYDEEEVAFRYRHRAEEIRAMAEGTRDHLARRLLLNLASDYERLVETLHQISAKERDVRSRLSKLES